jgi:hypothetical protein
VVSGEAHRASGVDDAHAFLVVFDGRGAKGVDDVAEAQRKTIAPCSSEWTPVLVRGAVGGLVDPRLCPDGMCGPEVGGLELYSLRGTLPSL